MKNWEICSYQLNISRVSFLFSDSSGQKGPLCSFEPIFMCKGWITILFSKVGQTMSFRKRSTLVFWIQSGSSHLITFSTKLVKWHLYNIKVSQHNITILEFITRNKDVSRWTGTWWFSRDKFSHSDFFLLAWTSTGESQTQTASKALIYQISKKLWIVSIGKIHLAEKCKWKRVAIQKNLSGCQKKKKEVWPYFFQWLSENHV